MERSGKQQPKDDIDLLNICLSFRRDIRIVLERALELSTAVTEEQFLSELVGKCPGCGSDQTGDCEHVEGIRDFTLGLCAKCGYLWCLECGRPVAKGIACGHWEICRRCDEAGASGRCGTNFIECAKLNGV